VSQGLSRTEHKGHRNWRPFCAEMQWATLRCSATPNPGVYGLGAGYQGKRSMPFADTARTDGTVEECLDELEGLLTELQHYTPTVLALALHVHLETLLLEVLEGKVCTRAEVRAYVEELERDALRGNEELADLGSSVQ
jgi:hypothetical protein